MRSHSNGVKNEIFYRIPKIVNTNFQIFLFRTFKLRDFGKPFVLALLKEDLIKFFSDVINHLSL